MADIILQDRPIFFSLIQFPFMHYFSQ